MMNLFRYFNDIFGGFDETKIIFRLQIFIEGDF